MKGRVILGRAEGIKLLKFAHECNGTGINCYKLNIQPAFTTFSGKLIIIWTKLRSFIDGNLNLLTKKKKKKV